MINNIKIGNKTTFKLLNNPNFYIVAKTTFDSYPIGYLIFSPSVKKIFKTDKIILLQCDGREVKIRDYPELYNIVLQHYVY